MTRIIALDPGHGGGDPGAVGPTGLRESDVVLRLALQIRPILVSYGHRVVLTRVDDYSVGLITRARIANEAGADVLLSLHCNAFEDRSAHGYEAWTDLKEDDSDALAEKLLLAYSVVVPSLRNRGEKDRNLTVVYAARMPAVLFEYAFISNPAEEQMLASIEWLDRAARAHANALHGWVGP